MLINFIIFLVGIIGAVSVSFGCWLIYNPVGYIVAGFFCLLLSYLLARSLSQIKED